MIKSFKDLDVYKKAFQASLSVHALSREFPKEEQFSLTSQIRRASKSICANIAEGFAKQKSSKVEFKRYLMIAYGSASEMLVWIDYCSNLGYIDQNTADEWNNAYEHISKMLFRLHDNVPT